jgi:hypothetical protein
VPDNARGDGVIRAWVEDRTDPSPRPLHPAPSYAPARLDQEEAILAHLLAHPDDLYDLNWLPADVFTADLRHLYLTTMRSLHDGSQAMPVDAVAAGVDATLSQLSPWHRTAVENTSSPQAYLHRTALTPVEPLAAFANAEHLLATDTRLSLVTAATTYVARDDYWLQPRPMRHAVDAPPVIAAVTAPGRQQVWALPPSLQPPPF